MDSALTICISSDGLTIAAITVIVVYAVKLGLKIIKYIAKY